MVVISRNPYFSGFFLAIPDTKLGHFMDPVGRNPYFSGFFLAIPNLQDRKTMQKCRNPYFSGFFLAIFGYTYK